MKKSIVYIFALVALILTGCAGNQASAPTLDEVFASRRSIRAYEAGRTISEAEVRELLLATQNSLPGPTSSPASTM